MVNSVMQRVEHAMRIAKICNAIMVKISKEIVYYLLFHFPWVHLWILNSILCKSQFCKQEYRFLITS